MGIALAINDNSIFLKSIDFDEVIARVEQVMGIKDKIKVELNIINNQEIKKLNQKYRNIAKTTDVLSFPLLGQDVKDKFAIPIKDNFIGQIFISKDQAKIQAEQNNIPLENEINKLFVHGLLHLLGYDHQTDSQENEMNKLEKQILN